MNFDEKEVMDGLYAFEERNARRWYMLESLQHSTLKGEDARRFRGAFDSLLHGMNGPDLAYALALAAGYGSLRLALDVEKELRGRVVSLSTINGEYVASCSVDEYGNQVDADPIRFELKLKRAECLSLVESGEEYLALLRVVRLHTGSNIVNDPAWASLLLPDALQKSAPKITQKPLIRSGTKIPDVVNGRVLNPSLLLGLMALADTEGNHPDWFDDIPCWADEASILANPGVLDPVFPLNVLVLNDEELNQAHGALHFANAEEPLHPDVQAAVNAGKFSVKATATFKHRAMKMSECHMLNSMLSLNLQGGDRTLYWLDGPQGMYLCVSRVRELRKLPRISEQQDAAVTEALKTYFPAKVLVSKAKGDDEQSGVVGRTLSIKKFFDQVEDQLILAEHAKTTLPSWFLEKAVAALERGPIPWKTYVGLNLGFGHRAVRSSVILDNDYLDRSDMPEGLSIPDGVSIEVKSFEEGKDDADYILAELRKVCEPGVLLNGLSDLTSDEDLLAYLVSPEVESGKKRAVAQLVARGRPIATLARLCTRSAHWEALQAAYGSVALEPYADKLPDVVLTRAAIDSFEL